MVHTTFRARFAAARIVVPDALRGNLHKVRVDLSGKWRRDADAIRHTILKAEHAAVHSFAHGWTVAKPRLHRAEDSAQKAWRVVRPRLVAAEHHAGARMRALVHRVRRQGS